MKTGIIIAGMALALTCSTTKINAQELPMPSPGATVEQRVGLTDIKIEYSRPGVKDRQIWGSLVPYGEVWRTGANKNTTITFSHDVTIEGNAVKAGTYSIFTIPNKDNWKVIFNSQAVGWGTGDYDESKNVATVTVKPSANAFVESLLFSFDEVNGDDAKLSLSWEKVKVTVKISVNSDAMSEANIAAALEEMENIDKKKASVYRNAARYYASKGENLDEAVNYINMAIELNGVWYYYLTKAEVLFAKGDKKGALAAAKEAGEKGVAAAKEAGEEFAFQSNIDEAVKKYQ